MIMHTPHCCCLEATLSLLSDRMSARQLLCSSTPLLTLDQHSVHNLLDLAWALGYADALVSLAQCMQRSRTMSGSVTTGQRVRHGGEMGLLAQQRVRPRRIC